jgi:hypothetical protein
MKEVKEIIRGRQATNIIKQELNSFFNNTTFKVKTYKTKYNCMLEVEWNNGPSEDLVNTFLIKSIKNNNLYFNLIPMLTRSVNNNVEVAA